MYESVEKLINYNANALHYCRTKWSVKTTALQFLLAFNGKRALMIAIKKLPE
jgi:hypothetical protein